MNVMRKLIISLLAATWVSTFIQPAIGADIRHIKSLDELQYSFPADVIFEGPITTGDYDKLVGLFEMYCREYGSCPSGIFLASPGGNLIEAMKIGRLVRRLRLETVAPSQRPPPDRQSSEAILNDPKANYMCVSACFFIFVAGVKKEQIFSPILGIHRPYLSDTDLKKISANQAIASTVQLRTLVDDYFKEMGVPAKYVDLIFSIPKDQVRFINEDEFDADFKGYIPELGDWLDAQCDKLTDADQKARCAIQLEDKLREDAWKQFRGR